jgi:hypothetical protein
VIRSNLMFEDLIDYVDLHEAYAEMYGFGEVTFKRDFGPWKAGEKVDSLWFILEKATAEEQSNEGAVIRNCKFQLTAVS